MRFDNRRHERRGPAPQAPRRTAALTRQRPCYAGTGDCPAGCGRARRDASAGSARPQQPTAGTTATAGLPPRAAETAIRWATGRHARAGRGEAAARPTRIAPKSPEGAAGCAIRAARCLARTAPAQAHLRPVAAPDPRLRGAANGAARRQDHRRRQPAGPSAAGSHATSAGIGWRHSGWEA
jgi:hypothetical protein